MKIVDYIVVGQGLAGTLLTHFLEQQQQKVFVINTISENAASSVAAGIVNPITGRRYVKSWMVDTLIPFAAQTYATLSQQLGVTIFSQKNIIRTLFNRLEEDHWWLKSDEEGYAKYMLTNVDLGNYKEYLIPDFSYGEVTGGGQANVALLTEHYRHYLVEKGNYQTANFDIEQIEFLAEGVEYQNIKAKKIIFCEGYAGKFNPYFSYLPFGGAKGEVLIVRLANIHFEKLIKRKVFITPWKDDLYWIGATMENHFEHELPTEKGKTFLMNKLQDFLAVPFEIVEHKSAVRPTVKDRRPFLGVHPEFPQLAIFNGLGTKGASLAPFFAHQMAQFLVQQTPLHEAVNIERFGVMKS